MKHVVIVVGPGFEDSEYIYPYYRFQEANFTVDVASYDSQVVCGKYGIPASVTMATKDLDSKEFDIIFIPGGNLSPEKMRMDENITNFVADMNYSNKIIAAICHGPWVLISAKIMRNREATCYKGMKDDLINAGAIYSNEPVVVDGNIITAQHYRDNPKIMKAILNRFNEV